MLPGWVLQSVIDTCHFLLFAAWLIGFCNLGHSNNALKTNISVLKRKSATFKSLVQTLKLPNSHKTNRFKQSPAFVRTIKNLCFMGVPVLCSPINLERKHLTAVFPTKNSWVQRVTNSPTLCSLFSTNSGFSKWPWISWVVCWTARQIRRANHRTLGTPFWSFQNNRFQMVIFDSKSLDWVHSVGDHLRYSLIE